MIKIKLNSDSITAFAKYINECLKADSILRYEDVLFNSYVNGHLVDLKQKMQEAAIKVIRGRKIVSVTIDYLERLTLSYVFQRVKIDAYLSGYEYQILMGL